MKTNTLHECVSADCKKNLSLSVKALIDLRNSSSVCWGFLGFAYHIISAALIKLIVEVQQLTIVFVGIILRAATTGTGMSLDEVQFLSSSIVSSAPKDTALEKKL